MCASRWAADLGTAVAPWGARVQARFDTLGAFNDEEVHYAEHHVRRAVGAGLATLSTSCMTEGELDTAIRCLAVRLYRLEKLLAPDGMAPPSEPSKKRPVGHPGDKRATEQRNMGFAAKIDGRRKGKGIADACHDLAKELEFEIDAATIERESLPYRKKRGSKIPRTNYPRR